MNLVGKPSQMAVFDALYSIAAGDGRGEALFGDSFGIARGVYERTLIGDGYPTAYIEFPLLGSPGFDLLTVHSAVRPGSRFAPGAGFGYQAMIDWFSGICDKGVSASCGIELDTSVGETERAGVYLQYRKHTDLIAPFLASIGEEARAKSYLAVADRMPEGWPPAYVGLFPGRAGAPLRVGGYLEGTIQKACAADPALLVAQFDRIGFSAYNGEMLSQCGTLLSLAPSVDFQFDIMPDGTLGDVFGLSLSFNETKPREARVCMESGYGARICRTLQEWGLADERWRLIAGAAFARHVPFDREDGSQGRFALCCMFNYTKVKFANAVSQPAKFYLRMSAGEVEA
jgi:hypothetical protein